MMRNHTNEEQKVLVKSELDYAAQRNQEARDYLDIGDIEQALSMFQEVYNIRTRILGPHHFAVIEVIDDMAGIYRDNSRPEEAIWAYQTIFHIRSSTLGADHPDLVDTLDNLAIVYVQDKSDPVQALEYYSIALRIRETALGPNNLELIDTTRLDSMIEIYRKLGDYDNALLLCQRTLKIIGELNLDAAYVYKDIAAIYDAQGKQPEALKQYMMAVMIEVMVSKSGDIYHIPHEVDEKFIGKRDEFLLLLRANESRVSNYFTASAAPLSNSFTSRVSQNVGHYNTR